MAFLHNIDVDWWKVFAMVIVIGMLPLFRALAVILVAKFVKPDIAKLALPLIFQRRTGHRPESRQRQSETDGH